MDVGTFLTHQLYTAVNQQQGERVNDPVESLDESHTRENEHGAHDQRTQNSPEQDSVLVSRRHIEVTKNQEKDEKIVDTQGKLYHISGDELQGSGMRLPDVKQNREEETTR